MTRKTFLQMKRRDFLKGTGAAVLSAPFLNLSARAASNQVVVRNPGGVYEDTMRKAVYDPFTAATGIEVISVPATFAKLMAMYRAGHLELDVIDISDGALVKLEREGAIEKIDYDSWTFTDPSDITPDLVRPHMVGNFLFATVMGYSTEAFSAGNHPGSWAEFWDVEKYPGDRMLADIASGQPNLEFALLADGVAKEDLYPLDLDRAFASMTRIRPAIKKFWDSGALSAQMMADQEVVLGSIWNGRLQSAAKGGAPLAIEWNENMLQVQAYGIFKDAPNAENAQKLVDFACGSEPGKVFATALNYGPANRKAYDLIDPALLAEMPGSPELAAKGFLQDVVYWEDNREEISRRWADWVIE
ncbi:ABC transporter substrate-binding protein [Rhodobium gokarnense]|uniref:Spermidine/putrescine transport system substrate-binding protein n=1 Tax=Rhodobium gokarnense TaxID=364296 RepID=A0ABT3HG57_9HYPH|nr:ABC transporter substrate-binding protein [Rhodobium gokarnense]MCW2309381.1 putative spermidine/putrescine transport system substrate-binding protein [Rhodobium gokarnense]